MYFFLVWSQTLCWKAGVEISAEG